MSVELAAVLAHVTQMSEPPEGLTSFCHLSQEARDLIIRAAMGEFAHTAPPDMTDSVRDELIRWALEPDPEEAT